MSIGSAIFNPKLLVPRTGKHIIRRERLNDLLHDNIQMRVQVLTAPAGYGKTTLLANFVKDLNAPVCWYTIDSTDEDPRVLLEGILASIRSSFPDFGAIINSRLLNTVNLIKDAPQLLNTLASEINSEIKDFFVIVLDDYHYLQNSEPARQILNLFLERAPDNCHIIISSRVQVELPAISKTVLQNHASTITASQLCLTTDETKALISEYYGINLSNKAASNLTKHTGGWIMGVLYDINNWTEDKLEKQIPSPSQEDVYRFLTSEIFDKQQPIIQAFLLRSSTLEELSPEMCNQLFPSMNCRKILRQLEQENLLSQYVHENKKWYRYQQIFRDFLQTKLLEDNPEVYEYLHSEAALLYEQNQRWNEAVNHYIAASQYDNAVRIIKAIGTDFFKLGKWMTISKWLETLPSKVRISDPELIILNAQTMTYIGQVDEAIHMLTNLVSTLSSEKDWLLKAKALSWRSAAFRLNGYFREARTDISTAIRLLEQNNGPLELLGDTNRRLGDIHAEQGRFSAALRNLKHALRCFSSVYNVNEIALVHNSLGITYMRLGQLARAKMHFEKARAGWLKTRNFGVLASALNNIGLIYQRMGQYDMALDSFRSGLEKAKESGYRRVEAGILISMADILRDTGLYQDAITVYQEGLDLARKVMEASFVAYATAGIGETYRLQGETEKAEILLKEAQHQAEEQEQPYEAALFTIPLGIIEYERGQFEKAISILNKACQRLETMGDKDALAKAYFHLAQASFLSRNFKHAIEWLEKVSNLAEELGYEDFLVNEGQRAIPLIQYGATKGIGDSRFSRILEKINNASEANAVICISGVPNASEVIQKPDIEALALTNTQVTVGNHRIADVDWRSSRAKEIFFYLLTHRNGKTKEQIIAALWPDLSLAKGTSNLHINLFRARRALYPGIFIFEDGCYKINPNLRVKYDVSEFENLLSIAESSSSPVADRVSALERAVKLYNGTFLGELYGEWIEVRRRELENKYLRALSLLADYHASQRSYHRAVVLLEKYIAVDPYEDDVYCRIMRWHMADRNRALALRTYKQYLEVVEDGVSSESSREIQKLYQRIVSYESPKNIQN